MTKQTLFIKKAACLNKCLIARCLADKVYLVRKNFFLEAGQLISPEKAFNCISIVFCRENKDKGFIQLIANYVILLPIPVKFI